MNKNRLSWLTMPELQHSLRFLKPPSKEAARSPHGHSHCHHHQCDTWTSTALPSTAKLVVVYPLFGLNAKKKKKG